MVTRNGSGTGRPNPKQVTGTDVQLGARLRNLRLSRGLSLSELGERLGKLSFQQIQKYERGTCRISATRLYEIAMLFKVPINYFFDEPSLAAPGAGPIIAAAAQQLASIPDLKVRRNVLRLIDSVSRDY